MWVRIKLVFVASVAILVTRVSAMTTPAPEDNITDLDLQAPPVLIDASQGRDGTSESAGRPVGDGEGPAGIEEEVEEEVLDPQAPPVLIDASRGSLGSQESAGRPAGVDDTGEGPVAVEEGMEEGVLDPQAPPVLIDARLPPGNEEAAGRPAVRPAGGEDVGEGPVGVEEGLGEEVAVMETTGEGTDSNSVNTISDVRNVEGTDEDMSNQANQGNEDMHPPLPDEDMLSPEILVMRPDVGEVGPEGSEFTPIPLETMTVRFDEEGGAKEPMVDDIGGMSATEVEAYYRKYNYLGSNMPDEKIARLADSNMTAAIVMATQIFQRKFGLPVTGELDPMTMSMLQMPRCGVPDIINMEDMASRKKRYTLYGGKWEKDDLTYRVTRYPQDGDLSPKEVDKAVRQAFKVWQTASALSFRRLEDSVSKPDIEIMFTDRVHGDGFPFDGPSGTLAHAFYPVYGGASHFDEAEMWTVNTNKGINLFQVAAHEFGHALGLAHSNDVNALMAPFYAGYIPDFELPTDDIIGIQAKYGPPGSDNEPEEEEMTDDFTTMSPEMASPMPPDMEDICDKATFNAITIIKEGDKENTYVFKGMNYYLIDPNGGISSGYPRKIQDMWPELPNDIDAALYRRGEYDYMYKRIDGRWKLVQNVIMPPATYIFKGKQYWKIEDMKVLQGYPLSISDWGLDTSIDAAFVWNYNGAVYFIKDDQYYKYEETKEQSGIASGYPRPLSNWKGLPNRIDTAFQWDNDIVYFFSMDQYYAFNDQAFQVDRDYPRNNDGFWLRCYRFKSQITEVQDQGGQSLASEHIPSMLSVLTSCLLLFTHL